MHNLLLGLGFGLPTSAVLALSGVALSLQYSVTNIPNFAHGELITIGAYGAYIAQQRTGSVPLEVLTAVILGMLLALATNKLVLEPFTRRGVSRVLLFVLTIAVSFLMQNVFELIFGAGNVTFSSSRVTSYHLGPFLLTSAQLWTIGVGVAIMLAVHLILKYTLLGKAQRAVADSVPLAKASGVPAGRIITVTWLMDGAIAGLCGFVLAESVGTFSSTLGFGYLLPTFAAVVVGGIGKPYGAMLGALVVGEVTEVGAFYIPPDYKQSLAFGILILTLFIRPRGFFGVARENALGASA